MTTKLTIVVPVFDEEEGIRATLDALTSVLDSLDIEYEILVVDDGSTDATGSIVAELPGIRIIENERRLGYGAAVKRGIRHASHDLVLMTDGDASYPAKNIPVLLEQADSADMVVGARDLDSIHNPGSWNLAKRAFQSLLGRSFGQAIPDLNSGMRVVRRQLALELEPHLSDAFSYSTGLTVGALRTDKKVRFVPITYTKRRGRSKVRPLSFSAAFLRSIWQAWRVPR